MRNPLHRNQQYFFIIKNNGIGVMTTKAIRELFNQLFSLILPLYLIMNKLSLSILSGGCVLKKPIILALIVILTLFAEGCVTSPAPTVTPTIAATPTPLATAPQNITVTLQPGEPTAIVTITHYIHGMITYNKQPTAQYYVIVETDKGNEYRNVTDANGNFNVTFPDDGSATYRIKLADSGNNLIFQDRLPRYMNATGPMNISIEIPSTNKMNVTIT